MKCLQLDLAGGKAGRFHDGRLVGRSTGPPWPNSRAKEAGGRRRRGLRLPLCDRDSWPWHWGCWSFAAPAAAATAPGRSSTKNRNQAWRVAHGQQTNPDAGWRLLEDYE